MKIRNRMILLAYSCFFLSGATGLLFEMLWTRQLTREMGGAAFAVSVVLTLFMAGLGLGALAGGRLADGRLSAGGGRRLLLAYGAAEATAALLSLLVPVWLRVWHTPLAWAYVHYQGGFFLFQSAVLAASLTALLPPAFAMGLSLPILTRFCAVDQRGLGRHFGGLYAVNSLGAALGALWAGFFLIPDFGLPVTVGVGVGLNFFIAAVCSLAAWRSGSYFSAVEGEMISRAKPGSRGRVAAPDPHLRSSAFLALGLLAFSGFCALAYEVLWTKLLTLTFGPTTYAFTAVLAAFIAGLAAGGGVFGRVADRTRSPLLWLIGVQAAAALAALAASQRMGSNLVFFQKANLLYFDRFAMQMAVKSLYVLIVLFVPTFLFGATLPLAAKLWGRYRQALGATAGDSYLWNTAGAVAGSWCAGFILLPVLGKENSLKLLAVAQATVALAASLGMGSWFQPPTPPRRGMRIFIVSIAAFTLALAFVWPRWPREALIRVNSANADPRMASLSWLDAFRGNISLQVGAPGSIEYFGDGLEGFTAVWKMADIIGIDQFSLYLSGKADASSRGDMFTQTLLAHFPMAVHPDPKDVMVLGLASGITAGEVLHYPVRHLDVLEINPKVVKAARLFAPWNNGVLDDPRVRVIVQDAKAHLLLSGRRYDVIISEPSNPWMAGLAELFTREFYARAKTSLNPGGVMAQFIHSYKMDWETFCLVGRTFHAVFPDGILVRTMPDDRPVSETASDYLLVGFNPPTADGAAGTPWSILDSPERRAQMSGSRNVEIPDPRILYRLVTAENLGELFGEGPLHTVDHPRLEFQAPRLMFLDDGKRIETEIAHLSRLSPRTQAEVAVQKADPGMRLAFAAYALSLYRPFPGMADLKVATPEQREAYAKRAERYCSNEVVPDFEPFDDDPELLRRCSVDQMAILNRALPNSPFPAEIYLQMATVCMVNNVPQNAVKFFRAAAEAAPGTPMADYALEQAVRISAEFQPPR